VLSAEQIVLAHGMGRPVRSERAGSEQNQSCAGFEDYLFAHKSIAKDLFHSRSDVDLAAMQGNGGDAQDETEDAFRLESLRAWDRQAIVCTVDTVLGLMQSQRRPLFSFPALMAGAFVFDEIHSYDARMFGILLRFLETFRGVPVLLMSASIPPQRLAPR